MAYDYENETDKPTPDCWLPMACCPSEVWEQFEPSDKSPFVTVYEDSVGGIWVVLNDRPTEDDERMQPIGCAALPSSPSPSKP